MKFSTIKYYLEEAVKNLFRNGIMTLSSIATVAACIFIVTVAYCVAVNIDYSLKLLEDTFGLTVSISNDLDLTQVNELRDKILGLEYVESVDYISADEGLERFAESFGEYAGIVRAFKDNNPLPRTFTIILENVKYQPQIVDELNSLTFKESGVSAVRHAQEARDILLGINNVIRISCIFIILMLGLLAVIIVTNTIKITVNSRRSEVTIMKYVGATDSFIRTPFIYEGVLLGLIGGAIPLVVFWFGYPPLVEKLLGYSPLFREFVSVQSAYDLLPALIPIALVLGGVMGGLGSVSSLRKHLNV